MGSPSLQWAVRAHVFAAGPATGHTGPGIPRADPPASNEGAGGAGRAGPRQRREVRRLGGNHALSTCPAALSGNLDGRGMASRAVRCSLGSVPCLQSGMARNGYETGWELAYIAEP